MISRILKFELLGMVFISLLGSFLHFTFQLSHKFWLVGLFSAVNESTGEHLKLAVVPAILWVILERKVFKLKVNNFLFAKAIGIWLMPILIVVFFYGYKAVLGHHNLVLDIGIFILAVIIGQTVSHKIMTLPEFSQKFSAISFASIVVLFLAFAIFTFYQPHIFLFQDPISGGYGILK